MGNLDQIRIDTLLQFTAPLHIGHLARITSPKAIIIIHLGTLIACEHALVALAKDSRQLANLFDDTLKDIYFAEKKISRRCRKWRKLA